MPTADAARNDDKLENALPINSACVPIHNAVST